MLKECHQAINKGLVVDIGYIRDRFRQQLAAQIDNLTSKHTEERSSNTGYYIDKSKDKKNRLEYHELRWLLSALSTIACTYKRLGMLAKCEYFYTLYIQSVDSLFLKDSIESGNAYFMIALFYFEIDSYSKSLVCFKKALYIRTAHFGAESLAAADCHANMAVLYKQMQRADRAADHFEKALLIRKRLLGPMSQGVVNTMEQLGKLYLQLSQFKAAYNCLNECFVIRKKQLSSNILPNK